MRHADKITTEELLAHGLTGNISQLPVVLLPVSFGNVGDRSIVLRPFVSPDFMTGIAALPDEELPAAQVAKIASRISQEVPGISRVLYDLSNKPPGTTEWE